MNTMSFRVNHLGSWPAIRETMTPCKYELEHGREARRPSEGGRRSSPVEMRRNKIREDHLREENEVRGCPRNTRDSRFFSYIFRFYFISSIPEALG